MADSKNNDVRILIVDDLESNRFVLKDIITDMGYQTLMAENGVQALKIVDRFMPQLIISDILRVIREPEIFRLYSYPHTAIQAI